MVHCAEGGVNVLCALLTQPECDLQTAAEYLVVFPYLKIRLSYVNTFLVFYGKL